MSLYTLTVYKVRDMSLLTFAGVTLAQQPLSWLHGFLLVKLSSRDALCIMLLRLVSPVLCAWLGAPDCTGCRHVLTAGGLRKGRTACFSAGYILCPGLRGASHLQMASPLQRPKRRFSAGQPV